MIPDTYSKHLQQLLVRLGEAFPGDESGSMHSSLHISNDELESVLEQLNGRLSQHYPFHQPWYAGQMLKPPHPAAWLAYTLAMTINPNNHAFDGGPESSMMEKEVINQLKAFAGFPENALGHLTSSGTIANLEALWIAREIHPDRAVAVSSQSHYTHHRMCRLLQIPVVEVPGDENGLPDPALLDHSQPLPGTIVVTLGTTGLGRVEPLHRITDWARDHQVRIHVDAAYGGFYHLLRDTGTIDADPWRALPDADSLVIDPHKHGLQPYGCGSVLFRDPSVGRFYQHDSPYTYFSSEDLHLGEISLECSRAGASAVALWMTLQLLPLKPGHGLGEVLQCCRKAALHLYDRLQQSERFHPVMEPELDIVTYVPVTEKTTFSGVSSRSAAILKAGMEAGLPDRLYLSTLALTEEEAHRWLPDLEADQSSVTVLRSVLMKPEHLDFVPEMMRRLEKLYEMTG